MRKCMQFSQEIEQSETKNKRKHSTKFRQEFVRESGNGEEMAAYSAKNKKINK